MKRNRKAWRDDDAVSPVIATILLVAIVVVLAATVFTLVSEVTSRRSETAPAFILRLDDAVDRLSVTSASPKADWNRLEITADQTTVRCALNAESGMASACAVAASGTFVDITSASDDMRTGEFLDLCITPANSNAVKITLRDVNANQIVGAWTFLPIETVCA